MAETEPVVTTGDKMKKTLKWVSEMQLANPEEKRGKILAEAQVRFDLSPKECEFLNKNFAK